MATETTTTTYDDVDYRQDPPVRTPADETVTFSFGDSGLLKLDLSAAHAKEIAEMLAPWIAAASPVTVARTRRARTEGTETSASTAHRTPEYKKNLREWAAAQGTPVGNYTRADGSKGGFKYSEDLFAEYDKFLAEQAGTDAK